MLVRIQSRDADLHEAFRAYAFAAVASLLKDGFALEPESEGGWHAHGNMFVFRDYRGLLRGCRRLAIRQLRRSGRSTRAVLDLGYLSP